MEKALKNYIVWRDSVGFGQNCPMLAVKNNTEWLSWDYSSFKIGQNQKAKPVNQTEESVNVYINKQGGNTACYIV